jgi:hypothetical protein
MLPSSFAPEGGNMRRAIFAAVTLSAVCLAAQPHRNWQAGRVISFKTTAETDEHSGSGQGGLLTTIIAKRSTTVTATQAVINGGDYSYVVLDHRKHPCRFIEGDDVQYERQKSKLDLLDADGKECRLDIVHQARLMEKR